MIHARIYVGIGTTIAIIMVVATTINTTITAIDKK